MKHERSRQIHLDFHTSELLPSIGAAFDKGEFQEALRIGHVNHINLFGKCHHSWSYYPTRVGTRHPNLEFDLLGRQIEACHEIGVTAPIYVTGGWSAADAEQHPEWCMRTIDGDFVAEPVWPSGVSPEAAKPTFQWKEMCVTGEYHELMVAQTEEICRDFPVDGLWYDIYRPHKLCYCTRCRAGMAQKHIDITDIRAVEAYRAEVITTHAQELVRVITGYHPEASVFFNGVTALERPQNFRHRVFAVNTKNDLEDLPTTWGGYDKLPLRAKIFHREKKPIVAMSGKFHTAWGEFGGFKDPEAMRFEAASMIAYGAGCNVGDHLHPLGKMDRSTYERIGHAYSYVETIEEYGVGGVPVASLGVWASYEIEADEGLVRMLLEEQIDFDVVAAGDDLSRYETIIVPSLRGILDGAEKEVTGFVEHGGKLIVLGEGLLAADGGVVDIPSGAETVARSTFDVDYTVYRGPASVPADDATGEALRRPIDLPVTPFLNYQPALQYTLRPGCEFLATLEDPYFPRTYGRYCGHQNTPNRPGSNGSPAMWRYGEVVVFAHSLDRMYYHNGAKVHRDLFATALRMLHPSPMVEVSLPSLGRVSLLHQREHSRYVAHLLYGPPIPRGGCLVIEDLPVQYDTTVRLRVPESIRRVVLIPDRKELAIAEASGGGDRSYREVIVPRFTGHCAVVAEY